MVMAIIVIATVIALSLALSAAVSWYLSRGEDALEKLGVPKTYPRTVLPRGKIEAYFELKEKLRAQFAKDAEEDRAWMSQLPTQAKDVLKFRLLQRAIGDMAALQKIDADARGFYRLFSKGMVTRTFWESVTEAEKELTQELEHVKVEASCVEPKQDPQGIINEAMQFVLRFGAQLPPGDQAPSADAIAEMLRQGPAPGAATGPQGHPGAASGGQLGPCPPGGMPLGPRPPGSPMPLHPGMMGPPRGPPPLQKGGEDDGYAWKQDTDELEVSVDVPGDATKNQIKVIFAARRLQVQHAGKVLVDGQLSAQCVPDGSTWTMGKGRVVISLEKADPRPWPSLFAPKG
mmetsp:Transcript_95876/g.276890  ORF Transcript_95876/g.276890 Transcript_95876/m.276890 type:complete len:345 (+) Transcript_95876:85-1119(+)